MHETSLPVAPNPRRSAPPVRAWALSAADAARVRTLRVLGGVGRRLVIDRELRVAVVGVSSVAVALGWTLVAPFWLLALGPLSVGVVHLLSDVRYLVVRPGYHRRPELLLAVGVPLALATTVGSALAICAAVMGAAASWLMLGPLPETATLEASSLARLARIPGLRAAPGWDPAGRLLLLFAFMQAVHYTIWIHLLPDEARPRRTTRSFSASWRALTADFGRLPLLLTLALIVGLAGWATFDLTAAHGGYFRMGAFHIPLEMAVLALWFTEGRPS